MSLNKDKAEKEAFLSSNKLKSKAEFESLRRNSKKTTGRHWILFYQKNSLERARLAVTVSGRFGNAVRRNRFKRWMRERFRKNKEKFCGFDLHFVAKSSKHEKDKTIVAREMGEDFSRLLQQFG